MELLNGQTATIQIMGAVDDAQSSLTPGQSYYVQDDGTLGESGSVFAGTGCCCYQVDCEVDLYLLLLFQINN